MNSNLNFNLFLIEMETTPQEKADLRTIIDRVIQGDKAWLRDHFIMVGDKGPFWMLNYQQGKRNNYNRLVRGMVVAKPSQNFNGDYLSLIKSFPFTRFFNRDEPDADQIDLTNAEMLEKLDGTMVGLHFPDNNPTKPEFHTRQMHSSHEPDMHKTITSFHGKEAKFLPMISRYIRQLNFSNEDVNFTFVFEFIHEISFVLTQYNQDQYGLYLLGARNLNTHRELTEPELDQLAKRIGSRRGRRWDAISDSEEIHKFLQDMAAKHKDFEGLVFRDKTTGKRIKLKDKDYVAKHHLLSGLHYKSLIPQIFKNETEETLAYFPQAKERIDELNKALDTYIKKAIAAIRKWQSTGLKGQALSLELFGQKLLPKWQRRLQQMRGETPEKTEPKENDGQLRNYIIKYINIKDEGELYQNIWNELKIKALGMGTNEGNPKDVLDIIGFYKESEE